MLTIQARKLAKGVSFEQAVADGCRCLQMGNRPVNDLHSALLVAASPVLLI
jgi:hypothetical protein